MTVFTFQTKLRTQEDVVSIRMDRLRDLLTEKDAGTRLFEEFGRYAALPARVHDKVWLEMILDWVPSSKAPSGQFVPDGLSITEQAKWIDLARRVRRLKEEDGATLRLYGWEVEMIWKRVTSQNFLMQRFSLALLEFLQEFGQATGNSFPGAPTDPPLLNEGEEEPQDGKSGAQLDSPSPTD